MLCSDAKRAKAGPPPSPYSPPNPTTPGRRGQELVRITTCATMAGSLADLPVPLSPLFQGCKTRPPDQPPGETVPRREPAYRVPYSPEIGVKLITWLTAAGAGWFLCLGIFLDGMALGTIRVAQPCSSGQCHFAGRRPALGLQKQSYTLKLGAMQEVIAVSTSRSHRTSLCSTLAAACYAKGRWPFRCTRQRIRRDRTGSMRIGLLTSRRCRTPRGLPKTERVLRRLAQLDGMRWRWTKGPEVPS